MSNYSKMYWLTRLDSIQGLLIFLAIISAVGLILYYIGRGTTGEFDYGETKERKKEGFLKSYDWVRKLCYRMLFISVVLVTFLPSKDDMILIYAGGKTMDFVQSDYSINKIPAQTTKFITDYLDKQVKELNKR